MHESLIYIGWISQDFQGCNCVCIYNCFELMCVWNDNLTTNYKKNTKVKDLNQYLIIKVNDLIIER